MLAMLRSRQLCLACSYKKWDEIKWSLYSGFRLHENHEIFLLTMHYRLPRDVLSRDGVCLLFLILFLEMLGRGGLYSKFLKLLNF